MRVSRILFIGSPSSYFLDLLEDLRARAFSVWVLPASSRIAESLAQLSPHAVLVEQFSVHSQSWLQILDTCQSSPVRVPVILLTCCGSEALAVKAFRAGVHDYFVAPVSSEALLESIERGSDRLAAAVHSSQPTSDSDGS